MPFLQAPPDEFFTRELPEAGFLTHFDDEHRVAAIMVDRPSDIHYYMQPAGRDFTILRFKSGGLFMVREDMDAVEFLLRSQAQFPVKPMLSRENSDIQLATLAFLERHPSAGVIDMTPVMGGNTVWTFHRATESARQRGLEIPMDIGAFIQSKNRSPKREEMPVALSHWDYELMRRHLHSETGTPIVKEAWIEIPSL